MPPAHPYLSPGTQSAHSSSFQLEMAQEGFSALLTPVSVPWPRETVPTPVGCPWGRTDSSPPPPSPSPSSLVQEGPVLGAVGAYDWSGGAFVYGRSGEATFVNVSRAAGDMNDAYLGKGCLGRGRTGPRQGLWDGGVPREGPGDVSVLWRVPGTRQHPHGGCGEKPVGVMGPPASSRVLGMSVSSRGSPRGAGDSGFP